MRKRTHKNMTLRRRLMIYLCLLVFVATGGVLLMIILTENMFVIERKIQTDLQEQMEIVRADMTEEMMSYTEYGMNLSVQAGQMIDRELQQKSLNYQELDGNQIRELRQQLYSNENRYHEVEFFDVGEGSGYQKYLTDDGKSVLSCQWSEKTKQKDTGEDVLTLTVPIFGSQGTCYGVCGVEVNAEHFKQNYPKVESKYGSMVAVVAPAEDGIFRLGSGMTGDADGTGLGETDTLKIGKNRYYHTYYADNRHYIGVQSAFKMPGDTKQEWVVAVLMPEKGCTDKILISRYQMALVVIAFAVCMIILASALSRQFVRPIVQSLEDIQESRDRTSSGIQELEELMQYLENRGSKQVVGDLPPDIEELFETFVEGVKTLTRAEYQIFQYYKQGYEVSQIPELAFISMSTVKKHNRSIYEKLHVSSYHELMLYIDLLRRCGRLKEL